MLVDVHGAGIERLLPGESQKAMGQGRRAHGRAQRCIGVKLDFVQPGLGHPFLNQLQAGDDAGQQIVEIVGDTARELAQCIHFLHLEQLRFSAHPLCHFLGQLGGGVVELRQLLLFALALFGDILDTDQAQLRGAIR
ncbi:hypothetical protein D3C76_1215700 [compost metagenome]